MSKTINSLKAFVDHIMKLREDSLSQGLSSYQWFFRGQENSDWSIYPNVFRNDGLAKETQTINSALRQNPFEFQNIKDFEIGEAGESLVYKYECEMIENVKKRGQIDSSSFVKWISREDDYAGYDILSYDIDSKSEKFIEVKTTSGGKNTPFYIFQ